MLGIVLLLAGCGNGDSPGHIMDGNQSPPSERLIVFASDRGRSAGITDVYVYSIDTPGYLPTPGLNVSDAVDGDPALTEDASLLFFETDRFHNRDVIAYDLARKGIVALPFVNTLEDETDPAPAADGKHLAFAREFNGYRRIHLALDWPPDTSVVPVGLDLPGAYDDFSPACDSTARRIAFVSNRSGNLDVLVWDRDSAGVLAVPDLATADDETEPAITPDGRYLAFASNRPSSAGGWKVYLYDLTTRAAVPLPGLAGADGDDREPSLGPGATRIAFQSNRAGTYGGFDIWVYDRTLGQLKKPTGLASTVADIQPWLRWY